ncbi:MAG: hypothetical protein SGJ27_10805 [Candidatus Melainabacteria bacterium]|nr:hypothetical protein [Candidatus Melainabacteria bacterium]
MSRDSFSSVLKQLGGVPIVGKRGKTGLDLLAVAYAQNKLGNFAESDEKLKRASELGFKKDQLKEILFKDVPKFNLSW